MALKSKPDVAVLGLGYVGLPLAAAFGEQFETRGYDIDPERVHQLSNGFDRTRELTAGDLARAEHLTFTDSVDAIADCTVYIVTVPTPIDAHKRPVVTPLEKASESVGQVLKPRDVVIFESTVYPGATEEVCVPILERTAGLKYNEDFFAGYSPERINPGDQEHRVKDILKVTSGSTPQIADFVDKLYATIITKGTHKCSSIRVAEAAKVIENTQRDVNIALVNELAMLFNRLGIDTQEVLAAAGTKWNFLPFRPGLVGGHCIGVDPYYLTHKAEAIGHHAEMILAGRRTNDSMGRYIVGEVVKLMAMRHLPIASARILILGLTFKENCPDIRNTQVVNIIRELETYNAQVDVRDPCVDKEEAAQESGIDLLGYVEPGTYDAVIVTVGHREIVGAGADGTRLFLKEGGVLYDVKSVFPAEAVDGRL